MSFETLDFNLSEDDKKKALLKGLGKGTREAALERKSDGFERKTRVHESKKKYKRNEKHKERDL
jgi:hypothetical protein